MGLGWILGRLNGRRIANHDGGTYGFSSSLFLDLDQQRASLVLANAFVPVTDLALHLLEPSIAPRDMAAQKRKAQREQVSVPASQPAGACASCVSPSGRTHGQVEAEGRSTIRP